MWPHCGHFSTIESTTAPQAGHFIGIFLFYKENPSKHKNQVHNGPFKAADRESLKKAEYLVDGYAALSLEKPAGPCVRQALPAPEPSAVLTEGSQ